MVNAESVIKSLPSVKDSSKQARNARKEAAKTVYLMRDETVNKLKALKESLGGDPVW